MAAAATSRMASSAGQRPAANPAAVAAGEEPNASVAEGAFLDRYSSEKSAVGAHLWCNGRKDGFGCVKKGRERRPCHQDGTLRGQFRCLSLLCEDELQRGRWGCAHSPGGLHRSGEAPLFEGDAEGLGAFPPAAAAAPRQGPHRCVQHPVAQGKGS